MENYNGNYLSESYIDMDLDALEELSDDEEPTNKRRKVMKEIVTPGYSQLEDEIAISSFNLQEDEMATPSLTTSSFNHVEEERNKYSDEDDEGPETYYPRIIEREYYIVRGVHIPFFYGNPHDSIVEILFLLERVLWSGEEILPSILKMVLRRFAATWYSRLSEEQQSKYGLFRLAFLNEFTNDDDPARKWFVLTFYHYHPPSLPYFVDKDILLAPKWQLLQPLQRQLIAENLKFKIMYIVDCCSDTESWPRMLLPHEPSA